MNCSFCLAADVILPGNKGLPLDGKEPKDFRIILIKPVLMFTGLVTEGAFTGGHDSGLQQVPV